MAARQRDVKVRILSEYYDAGSKAAERATRRLASLQMAAAAEDAQREAKKAASIAASNAAQATAMRQAGQVMLTTTAAVAVGIGLATKAAESWESAFTGVRKVVDGDAEQIGVLERQLRGLATTMPATHEEIANVAEAAGQLGVARQDIADFTRTAINMGETTNMAADEAATAMAQLSNIMGIGADKADEMGSAIVALGNAGASTESDIVSMALRIAGAGRSVGMTADQVLSISSALSSVGLEAEAGGSAISRVILQIDKDVRTGADTLGLYARTSGVTVEQFKQQWERDAAGTLTKFINGLGDLQKSGGSADQVIEDLGYTEIRTTDALRRAAYAGDLLNDALETGADAWRENNALTEEAARRYETAESRLAVAKNRLNDVAIDVGANFLPMLVDGATKVADLAEGFHSLPEPVQDWTIKLGTAATVLGGVTGAAAIAIPKLTELKDTVDKLQGGSSGFGTALGKAATFLTGPWGLAMGAAVVAGGFWLAQQGELKRNVQALTDSLDEQTGAITENTRELTVKALTESGALAAAAQMGLELDKVTDAALLNADAMSYVQQAIDAAFAANDQAVANYGAASEAIVTQADAAGKLDRALFGQREQTEASQEAWKQHAAAMGDDGDKTEQTKAAAEQLNTELKRQDQLASDAKDALDDLKDALNNLNDPTLDAREAARDWEAAIDAVTESAKENGHTLDINTEKGRNNQEALDRLARAGIERSNSILMQTGSIDDYNASLAEERDKLTDVATKFFGSRDAAAEYVDQVLAVPDSAYTQMILDTATAQAALNDFRSRASEQKLILTVGATGQVNYHVSGSSLTFYAAGDIRPMQPVAQMVPPRQLRVLGDRQDVPELYAPLDHSARSRSLWQQAGQMMGWDRQPIVVQVNAPESASRDVKIDVASITAADPAAAMAELGHEIRFVFTGVPR